MRARRHVARLLLVPAGMLAAHAAGWWVADPGGRAAPSHGHLPLVATLAVPLGLAGLLLAVLGGYRGRRVPARLITMAAGQAACFVVMEAAETASSGAGVAALLGQRALWLGLVLQLVAALAVRALLRTGSAAGSALRRAPRPAARSGAAPHPARPRPAGRRPDHSPATRRGPPQFLVP